MVKPETQKCSDSWNVCDLILGDTKMKPELLGDNPFLPQTPLSTASGVTFSTWMGQMARPFP